MGETSLDPLAQAWALKTECYEAWHREPRRTRDAANACAALACAGALPEVQALADWTDGIALMAEGRLLDALERLGAAERGFQSLGDEQHAAEVQVPQMGALSFLGREAEVVALGQRALQRFVARGDERSAAKVEINLGTSWSRQDRHVEAEQAYREAAARGQRLGDPYLAAMAGIGLANALTWQFRSAAALRAAAQARRLARASGHAILDAQTLEATGQIELNRGHWAAALAAFARALARLEAAGASPQRRLECETALADAYAAVHLHDEAIALYRRIGATAAALPAPNEQAYAQLQLGRVQAQSGQAEAALQACAAARALYVELGNAAALWMTDLAIARLQLEAGATEAALATARATADALARAGIRGPALEARALEAAALMRQGQQQGLQGALAQAATVYEATLAAAGDLGAVALECHAGQARLAVEAGDLPRARAQAQHGLRLLDAQRQALPADELRAAMGGAALALHDTLVATARARGDAADLLVDIEQGRARALDGAWNSLGRRAARALSGRLVRLRQAWREAMADDDGARLPALDADLLHVESALLEAQRRQLLSARRRRPQDPASTADARATVAAWQRALGPARALVAFHRQGDALLTVVLTDREVRWQAQAAEGLADRIAGLRLQVEAARNPALAARHGALLAERLRDHAQALHARLWAPVAALLDGRRDVVVVPHGPLHDLPWAMLHDGRAWLAQHWRISSAPSVAVWARLQTGTPPAVPARVVAAGVPGAGLAHVGREIASVASAHGAATVVLEGAAATAAAIRRATREPVDVLHLACHARFRADNPAFSTLQLADGPLPLHELARWRLQAQLVVLSACETGVSRVAPGDEAYGLVRAVMLAGARSVLAAHWAVADGATADLFGRVHAALRDGQGPAAALQAAQAEAAAAGRHPYHWAGFAVHGAGG